MNLGIYVYLCRPTVREIQLLSPGNDVIELLT